MENCFKPCMNNINDSNLSISERFLKHLGPF